VRCLASFVFACRRGFAPCAATLAVLIALFGVPPGSDGEQRDGWMRWRPGRAVRLHVAQRCAGSLEGCSYRDHYILVSGTCTEVVILKPDGENITIVGCFPGGAVLAEPSGVQTTYAVFEIFGAARDPESNT